MRTVLSERAARTGKRQTLTRQPDMYPHKGARFGGQAVSGTSVHGTAGKVARQAPKRDRQAAALVTTGQGPTRAPLSLAQKRARAWSGAY